MSEDEKQDFKKTVASELMDVFKEFQKPAAKGIRGKLSLVGGSIVSYLTFALVSAGSIWGWGKAKEFAQLLDTPKHIAAAEERLAVQIKQVDTNATATYEPKELHNKDIAIIRDAVESGSRERQEIKAMVKDGESTRQQLIKTLDEHGKQLSSLNASMESIARQH
jgi:hypothetical protein